MQIATLWEISNQLSKDQFKKEVAYSSKLAI